MALIAGILILIMPRLLNLVVAIYLIFIGLIGLGLLKMASHVALKRRFAACAEPPKRGVRRASSSPSRGLIVSHGQSRIEAKKIAAKSKPSVPARPRPRRRPAPARP